MCTDNNVLYNIYHPYRGIPVKAENNFFMFVFCIDIQVENRVQSN